MEYRTKRNLLVLCVMAIVFFFFIYHLWRFDDFIDAVGLAVGFGLVLPVFIYIAISKMKKEEEKAK